MSSRARMLTILDFFNEEEPAWTAEDILRRLGCSRPTAYRYVKELCGAGLLLRLSGGLYVVGPRILELERLIQLSNPLVGVARPIMRDLVHRSGGDVLLANVYGDQVMIVHREHGPDPVAISYDRGRPHPMFRGATSKAVLPYLNRSQLVRIYEAHPEECREAGLGGSWKELLSALAIIRRDGYVVGKGELDEHVMGLAAPIFTDEKRVLGTLTLIMAKRKYELMNHKRLLELVLESSDRMTSGLSGLALARITFRADHARGSH